MGTNRAVTARAVTIGLVCAALLCAITPYNDFKIAATYISGTQFPIGAIFVLLVLATLVNVPLRRWLPSYAFTPGELLTVWVLILVASGLPSAGMMRYFLPHIAAPQYFSDDRNNWQGKVWGDSPEWMRLTDKAAADAFFTGYPRGQERIPWEAWARPLFFWGILALLFLTATFCLANLLRRQWVENEKFTFPLVTLPVLIAEEPERGRVLNGLFRSPMLWIGFGVAVVLHGIRGLHQMYPSIPDITVSWNLMEFLKVMPWNQIGPFDAKIYPLVIGLGYLLPTEVGFSLWFFHLFYKFEILTAAQYNWDMPGVVGAYGYKQFHSLQAFGGGLALLLWTAWTARRHLRDFWEKATGGPRAFEIDDSGEMFSYRATLIGLCVAYGGIGLWLWLAGVPTILILLSLLLMTVASVVISWMVCQAGMLFSATPYGSIDVIAPTSGTAPFPVGPLYTTYRFEGMFFYDTREMMMPSLLMGTKTAEAASFSPRPLFRAVLASVAVGLVVSLVASLALPYYNGGGNSLSNPFMYRSAPTKPLTFLGGAASVPYIGSWTNWIHVASGLAGVLGLLVLRAQFNLGFHPMGFLIASVYSMHMLWFSFFLGWLFKAVIQRYGGMKGYTLFLPLFLGLIVGDAVSAVLWIALGYLTQVGYQVMPG